MADEYKRDEQGQFAEGNKGGPGRPPRAVERDYLVTLSDKVTPEVWADIVDKAIYDAKEHRDWHCRNAAREWLAKHLLAGAGSLVDVAVDEALDTGPVDKGIKQAKRSAQIEALLDFTAGLD